jgi:hypothetical protein
MMIDTRFWRGVAAAGWIALAAAGCKRESAGPAADTVGAASAPAESEPEDPRIAALQVPDTQPLLTTEDFEKGTVRMETVESPRLMTLLGDLKSRRAEDRAEHHGERGPDGAFLDERIRAIAAELQRRGFPVDNEGVPLEGR